MVLSELVLRGILANAYKMADGEITQLLTSEDGNEVLTQLLDRDKTRIQELRTTQFQDGFKAAKKEVLGTFEKTVREKFGISDASLQGESLIESIVTAKLEEERAANPNKGSKAFTDDDIKKHPLYLTLEQEKAKAVEAERSTWESKYNDREQTYTKDSRFSAVKEKALTSLNSDKYVYPADAEIAANQRGFVIEALKGYDYDEANGITYPSKDGKRLEDAHGNALTLDEFISSTAKRYIPIAASNGGGNPAPAGQQQAGGSKSKFVPKDSTDFMNFVQNKENSLEDRTAAMDEYGEKF